MRLILDDTDRLLAAVDDDADDSQLVVPPGGRRVHDATVTPARLQELEANPSADAPKEFIWQEGDGLGQRPRALTRDEQRAAARQVLADLRAAWAGLTTEQRQASLPVLLDATHLALGEEVT